MRRRVLATLILGGLLWIALPAVVLAGDCVDDSGWICLTKWVFTAPLLAAAVGAGLAGAALWRALGPPPPPPDPAQDEALDTLERPSVPPEQNPAYNPAGLPGTPGS